MCNCELVLVPKLWKLASVTAIASSNLTKFKGKDAEESSS